MTEAILIDEQGRGKERLLLVLTSGDPPIAFQMGKLHQHPFAVERLVADLVSVNGNRYRCNTHRSKTSESFCLA